MAPFVFLGLGVVPEHGPVAWLIPAYDIPPFLRHLQFRGVKPEMHRIIPCPVSYIVIEYRVEEKNIIRP